MSKKIITKEQEEELANIILEYAEDNKLTMTNIIEVTDKVMIHMSNNAILAEAQPYRKNLC